jgi:HEPN domain-containing protein
VNFREDAEYRKRLAAGFLDEARHNFEHQLWRSCVDNAQIAIENSCKMIIAALEPVEKYHNPARQLKRLLKKDRLSKAFSLQAEQVAAIAERFGAEEHFMTDYGDETTHTDPWSLFDEDDAREALDMAQKCFKSANEILNCIIGP